MRNSGDVLGTCVFDSQPRTWIYDESSSTSTLKLTRNSAVMEVSEGNGFSIVPEGHRKWEDPGADIIGPGDSAITRVRIDNNPMLICSIDGFSGSKVVLFLVPLVWNLVVLAFGLGLIGLASLGIAGRGALAGGR